MKLIDTGFLSFKKDRISIWFQDGFFCWMPDVVWVSRNLDGWFFPDLDLACDQSTSDTKVYCQTVRRNCNYALVYAYGKYVLCSKCHLFIRQMNVLQRCITTRG